jgi:formylglycine-generating enzyme required for sulfatase activity
MGGDCQSRAVRGHAWNSESWMLRSADRIGLTSDQKSSDVGFRVAKTIQ